MSDGLFGPGIFGTGIDLSALDEDTAYRLGVFMGEQLKAAEQRGYERGQEHLTRYVGAVVESQKLGPMLQIKDIALGLRHVTGPRATVCQEAADLIDPPEEQP